MYEFLTLKDIADELGVCYETARRWAKRKQNPLPMSPITHRTWKEDFIRWHESTLDKSDDEYEG